MKKALILVVVISAFVMLVLSSCKGTETEVVKPQSESSMFVIVEITPSWKIVYHRETKVMYTVSRGGSGDFTLLVNADGTPMVY